MNPSIRKRLLFILLSAIVLIWFLAVSISYIYNRHEIARLLDSQLAQSANVLLEVSRHELLEQRAFDHSILKPDHDFSADSLLTDSPLRREQLVFQVWMKNGELALSSHNAPSQPLSDVMGFSDHVRDGHRWRVYSVSHPQLSMKVIIAERIDIRGKLANAIAQSLLYPLLAALPLLAMVIWWGVGRALAPLGRVANDVANREPEHLEPVDSRYVPIEAKPLVDSLNGLFVRVQAAFDKERHFTADAAHGLRTPLAGIKTQAQVAQGLCHNDTMGDALQRVVRGVDTATRVVEQLLTLARLDPEKELNHGNRVNLCDVASAVIVELEPLAFKKHIEIGLSEPCRQQWAVGYADALAILVTNLVDNAIRYLPEYGHIEVSIFRLNDQVALSVADSGPGIPPQDYAKVMQRFYRRPGSQQPGSGLGLSIVQRIAELHGAKVELGASAFSGLEVKVIFP